MYKVLIVDDELDVCTSCANFLSRRGYQVDTAQSAEVALQKISENMPEVILLDITMPGMGGIEGLKQIKMINPQVSVIMVTASSDAMTSEEAMRLGASGYITKPVTAETLERLIKVTMTVDEAKRQIDLERKLEEDVE